MPILLSPEEISALSEWWLDADEDVDWAETLNKAQLKKVVEWLMEETGWLDADFGHYSIIIPPDEWQSLKEEAGL